MPVDLKQKIAARELAVGSWVAFPQPAIVEIMCNAGFDWIAVDLEHSTITLAEAEGLIRTIDGRGRAPLVRLTCNDAMQIKRVMDAGAHGVIVPNVRHRDDVLAAHRAMHYPPRGNRGVGLARAQGYGASFQRYREWLDRSAVLIGQIEHADALGRLDEIFGSEELDAFMIGPYDLTASMGIAGQFDHPEFTAALAEIRRVAAACGKVAGIHVVEPRPEELSLRVEEGYRFIAYSVDFRMIDEACRRGLRAVGR